MGQHVYRGLGTCGKERKIVELRGKVAPRPLPTSPPWPCPRTAAPSTLRDKARASLVGHGGQQLFHVTCMDAWKIMRRERVEGAGSTVSWCYVTRIIYYVLCFRAVPSFSCAGFGTRVGVPPCVATRATPRDACGHASGVSSPQHFVFI